MALIITSDNLAAMEGAPEEEEAGAPCEMMALSEPPLRNINVIDDEDEDFDDDDEYISPDQVCVLLQRNDPELVVSESSIVSSC